MKKTDKNKTDENKQNLRKMAVKCYSSGGDGLEERTLATFTDGTDFFDQRTAKAKAIDWADDVISAVRGPCGKSLLEKLNEIQSNCHSDMGKEVFPDKYDMPLIIVNYALDEYNLWIDEV